MLGGLGDQVRPEVGPAKVFGIQSLGLSVGGQGGIVHAVDVVGHAEPSAHQGRVRRRADRANQRFEMPGEILVRRVGPGDDGFADLARARRRARAENDSRDNGEGKPRHPTRWWALWLDCQMLKRVPAYDESLVDRRGEAIAPEGRALARVRAANGFGSIRTGDHNAPEGRAVAPTIQPRIWRTPSPGPWPMAAQKKAHRLRCAFLGSWMRRYSPAIR